MDLLSPVFWSWMLPLLMVMIGGVLFVAALYVHLQAAKLSTFIQKLLLMARAHDGDPLQFIPQSIELLQQTQVVGRVFVELRWFGQQLTFGEHTGRSADTSACRHHAIENDEIVLRALICPRKRLRGERAAIFELISGLWLELLSSQVNDRLAQIHFSEQQLKRYELFYKHDLKNLAQFMHLLSGQMGRCDSPECSHTLITRLKKVLPDLEKRANRILQHLGKKQADDWSGVECFSLAHLVEMEARAMDLLLKITGDAEVCADQLTFQHGLRNVMENFKQHPGTRRVEAWVAAGPSSVTLKLTSEALTGQLTELERARMFEPFWTTSRSGLGLGLYIARQNFQAACRATLDVAQLTDDRWAFVIVCPRQAGAG